MRVINPFKVFSPPNAKYFILGSFAAKDSKRGVAYDWYYSNGRNQFWRILEVVYGIDLNDKSTQQSHFSKLGIAIADIILSCERMGNSSLDTRLTNLEYNIAAISDVLKKNSIKTILFTSRFVETHYKRHFKELITEFPNIELTTLPSPSPRYARMSKEEKIKKYSEVFPKLRLTL